MSDYPENRKLKQYRKRIREYIRNSSYPLLARLLVVLLGFIFLFVGFLLLFLPGPAFLFIPLGLLLLATEFNWAKSLINKIVNSSQSLIGRLKNKKRDARRKRDEEKETLVNK